MTTSGLYLHIPFCTRKCDYCTFHSVDDLRSAAPLRMAAAIERDIASVSRRLTNVETLYVGGGTPTTLSPESLAHLIGSARAHADFQEITVEANPESTSCDHLRALAAAGVTRISVGVQTLEPEAARGLGRRATSIGELEAIRTRWDGSLSADLIHGAPGETLSGFLLGIDALIATGFDHLSVYGLGVEAGTPLARRVASGASALPAAETGWRAIVERIRSHGLRRYEVSNFARPGSECRHNLQYWRGDGYVGLGPSAVSTIARGGQIVRLTQPSDHALFLARRDPLECDCEHLSSADLRIERLMLGLRTFEGVDLQPVRIGLTARARDRLDAAVERECAAGNLRVGATSVRPTESGLDVLDRVVANLAATL